MNYGQGHGYLLYSHKLYDYVKHNDARIMHHFKTKRLIIMRPNVNRHFI